MQICNVTHCHARMIEMARGICDVCPLHDAVPAISVKSNCFFFYFFFRNLFTAICLLSYIYYSLHMLSARGTWFLPTSPVQGVMGHVQIV